MIIAVNTRFLVKDKLEGIGWFTLETLKKITCQHPEHQFHFLFDRPFSEEFIFSDNITPHILFPPARHPLLWYIWFEHVVAKTLQKIKPDVFLSTDGYLSLKTNVKSIPVIHDIAFEHYPKAISLIARKYYQHYFPLFAKKASRIATVSEFSKNDISEKYAIDKNKIDVVYNGANELYSPISEDEKNNTKTKYSDGKDYFLFIGGLHPRKNVENLFLAYDKFRESSDKNIKLLIIGKKAWGAHTIEQVYETMKYKEDVIFTNGIYNPESLKKIIGSALAMVYVSFFEGFGIPIIEAMYCNTPVITSNVSSMPEVSGSAALLVNPSDVDSIAQSLTKITNDINLRNQLIIKGEKQCRNFSWQKSADKLWECIEKVMSYPETVNRIAITKKSFSINL